ncbi:MAG: AAA family ATPase [Dehalococcoidia bacterium]
MGTVKYLRVENYRSIGTRISIRFPNKMPLVLVGQNNAGKTNVSRALDLVLGESWAGSHEPDDHEFHNRDKQRLPVRIALDVDDVWRDGQPVGQISWQFNGDKAQYEAVLANGVPRYMSNEIREQCVCVYVGADRRLSYQLSYVSRFTFLSKLMRKFHGGLISDEARVKRLQEKFAEVKAIFDEVGAFTDFSSRLKAQLDEFSSAMEYGLDIDFSAYDPSNYFHALKMQPTQGGAVRTFDELGTGQEQLLAFSFVQAYAEAFHGEGGLLLLVEEPEAHLHPLAQQWLATRVRGLSEAGVQVVITTHSPAFVDLLGLDGLVVVSKPEGETRVKQVSAAQLARHCTDLGAANCTTENVLPFYAAAATPEILEGLFARRVILVEGATEAMALPILLSRVGFDPAQSGIAIVAVHGVSNMPKWYRFFTAYGIPTFAIFDSDRTPDADEPEKYADIFSVLGMQAPAAAAARFVVGRRGAMLEPDFEQGMRTLFGPAYGALEKAATDQGLSGRGSKPLVARFVAEHLEIAKDSVPWKALTELGQAAIDAE